jgi:hypothetical protein
MLRRLFTFLAGLSLLLCVGICILRARPHFREEYAYQQYGGPAFSIMTTHKGVRWMAVSYRVGRSRQDLSLFQDTYAYHDGFMPPLLRDDPVVNDCDDGIGSTGWGFKFGGVSGRFAAVSGWNAIAGNNAPSPIVTGAPDFRFWYAVTPYWSVITALSILPAIRLVQWWSAKKRRTPAGICHHCGYDMRATPGRCPECGKAAPRTSDDSPKFIHR